MPNTDRDRLAQTLKFCKIEARDGYAKVSAKTEDAFMNGVDIAHGGFIFALADYATALASNSDVRAGITSSANMNFLAPVAIDTEIIAETKVVAETDKTGVYVTLIKSVDDAQVYAALDSRIIYKTLKNA